MYKTGDTVIYGSYGICKIDSIGMRDFTGENTEYYVLRPLFSGKNVFYIPVGSETALNKLHNVCSKETADKLIRQMKSAEPIWIDNEAKRKEEYTRIINSGSREEIIRMIKALRLRRRELEQSGKKLRSSDESFLTSAEKLLCEEFACALGIEREEVVEYINRHNE